MTNLFKKPFIYLTISVTLLFVVLASVLVVNFTPKERGSVPSPTPFLIGGRISPVEMSKVPYKSGDNGGGVNTSSPQVVDSAYEISKLTSSLPYQKDLNLSTGLKVNVLIPGQNLQINGWTLTVQIFGIDYQVTDGDKDYELMKKSFLEASKDIFSWMISQGVDPRKVIISWGDQSFIQQSAEKWLNSQ